MTLQVSETLILDGVEHPMTCFPPLPESHPRIIDTHTDPWRNLSACWRGYRGTWEIKQGRFYLVGIVGRYELQGGTPLFADWFTGTLHVSRGEIIETLPFGCGAVFEEELCVDIEKGMVTGERVIDNQKNRPS
jgi:hypothetical protein